MHYPTTYETLINNLYCNDKKWETFFIKYSTVIYDIGNSKGLSDIECNELVQNVMLRFNNAVNNGFVFDSSVAKFRTFFSQIVKNCIIDICRKRKRAEKFVELEEYSDEGDTPDVVLDLILQEKWQYIIFQEALDILKSRVKSETYQAFELYALQNRPLDEVTTILDLSKNSIYVAKSRCLTILKTIANELMIDLNNKL